MLMYVLHTYAAHPDCLLENYQQHWKLPTKPNYCRTLKITLSQNSKLNLQGWKIIWFWRQFGLIEMITPARVKLSFFGLSVFAFCLSLVGLPDTIIKQSLWTLLEPITNYSLLISFVNNIQNFSFFLILRSEHFSRKLMVDNEHIFILEVGD